MIDDLKKQVEYRVGQLGEANEEKVDVPRSDRVTFACDRMTDSVAPSVFVHVWPVHLYISCSK